MISLPPLCRCRFSVSLTALLALALMGCSHPTAHVSGKVTYQGKPLPTGTVTFYSADNKVVRSSQIATDGTYAVEKVPLGVAKISVTTPPPLPTVSKEVAAGSPSGDTPVVKPVPISPLYGDPEKSRLTCEVQQSNQTHNIDLK